MQITTEPEPAVVDLLLPGPGDFAVAVSQVDLEAVIKDGPTVVIQAGGTICLQIHSCRRARWLGSEWIFEVDTGNTEPLWVRATVKSNEWSEVDSL